MYYIGLDVHNRTISYCVKDAAGHLHREGKIGSTPCELDAWIMPPPQPRKIAIEATIFTGWIYDHVLPHAARWASLVIVNRTFARSYYPGGAFLGDYFRIAGYTLATLNWN
jgi:hypothetical protein